ncbi:MAG: WYL domain-containing protein [Lentisphaeria bacterium]|nr:WYL domain-containing protein [Lentisphaeria bacterium]
MQGINTRVLRWIKIVSELKKNNYPNAHTLSRLFHQHEWDEKMPYSCCERTILRDIKTLQKDYKAPIDYDPSRKGYYLRRAWDFEIPVMGDEMLSMTMLGTRLAGDLLPEPLKSKVNSAMDNALAGNNSEFFDEAMIESILSATKIKAAVNPEIFKTIFDAWRLHQVLKITYKKPDGELTERKFEPHIIAFHQGVWYAKGYDYRTRDIKLYAIQRISKAEFGLDTFETDKNLVEHTKINGLFEYPKIEGIKLHCDASTAFYLREHQKVKKFSIDLQPDGSLIITLRPAIEHEVIRFVLGEAGRIRVLYPEELRQKVAEAGKKIWEKNS